jgi:hypothetical protein
MAAGGANRKANVPVKIDRPFIYPGSRDANFLKFFPKNYDPDHLNATMARWACERIGQTSFGAPGPRVSYLEFCQREARRRS